MRDARSRTIAGKWPGLRNRNKGAHVRCWWAQTLAVVARRAGKKWYVAGVNADSVQKEISINFSFIKKNKMGDIFYNILFNNENNGEIETGKYAVSAKEIKQVFINPNDGFVMVFE